MPSFALLGKELTEQANRKRTYVLRILMISVMGVFVVMRMHDLAFDQRYSMFDMFSNVGRDIYQVVILCQVFSVLILLPAIMSPVITIEKERNSLELLFLTNMRPLEIILQKYLSRIIPFLMFFFLGLPLLAVAYSFGGIDSQNNSLQLLMLLISILQVGAYSLMFSAYCHTTAGAMICSYLVTIAQMFFFSIMMGAFRRGPEGAMITFAGFQIVTIFISLGLSIKYLKERAVVKKRFLYLRFLEGLDKFWKEWNKSFGGIEFFKNDREAKPWMGAIEFYDKLRSPVGSLTYKLRLMVFIYVPVLIMLLMLLSDNWSRDNIGLFKVMIFLYMFILAIVLAVSGMSAISREKSNQTLDLLLTTPMSSGEIVRQKMKRNRTYLVIFAIPIILCSFVCVIVDTQIYHRYRYYDDDVLLAFSYVSLMSTIVFAYLPLISWFSCWTGMAFKSRMKSVIVTMTGLTIWIAGPLLAPEIIHGFDLLRSSEFDVFRYLSPAYAPFEFFDKYEFFAPMAFYACAILSFALYISFRLLCIKNADHYLRNR